MPLLHAPVAPHPVSPRRTVPSSIERPHYVDTGQVESDDNRSRGEQVLGPYASEAEARAALDTAHKKTDDWDAEDRAWNERGAGGSGAGGGPAS